MIREAIVFEAADYMKIYTESAPLFKNYFARSRHIFYPPGFSATRSPEVLIPNSGTAFIAELMQGVLGYSNMDHRRTATYTPSKGIKETLGQYHVGYADYVRRRRT